MIPQDTLFEYNAKIKTFKKDEKIFSEADTARNYYQVLKGAVKMSNFNDDGKEFIQGIFYKEQSFGEPPLFIDVPYPANAITLSDSEIIILPKEQLFNLLNEHQAVHLKITANLAKRLYYKAIIASEISGQEPMHRILRFFDYLKNDVHELSSDSSFKIPHTRQQIADVLGLRVETVIRSIKSLEKKGEVKIISRKVYR